VLSDLGQALRTSARSSGSADLKSALAMTDRITVMAFPGRRIVIAVDGDLNRAPPPLDKTIATVKDIFHTIVQVEKRRERLKRIVTAPLAFVGIIKYEPKDYSEPKGPFHSWTELNPSLSGPNRFKVHLKFDIWDDNGGLQNAIYAFGKLAELGEVPLKVIDFVTGVATRAGSLLGVRMPGQAKRPTLQQALGIYIASQLQKIILEATKYVAVPDSLEDVSRFDLSLSSLQDWTVNLGSLLVRPGGRVVTIESFDTRQEWIEMAGSFRPLAP
jgi:hypothetical protein